MAFRLSQLPAQLTKTIGRAQEITTLSALLTCGGVRLLTLTGPGGVGKTRLALEVASSVQAEFADGVFFVSLAPLRDPALVPSAIVQALGLEEVADLPVVKRLHDYLRDKHILLLLDNFEQILDAGELVTELLATSPRLSILTTSRAVLHLYGEHEFEVTPLELPALSQNTPSELVTTTAMQLFIERAQALQPSFEPTVEALHTIAQICIQLDGLPLAIELAAARIKMLTLGDILARLQNRLSFLVSGPRNLPKRQQTLRNTLDWSYGLLEETEQSFFRRLGVLVGTWTLAAAEAVGIPAEAKCETALDLLSSLVDKSFVRAVGSATGEMRFTLLETIREYALDCLGKTSEYEVVQRQHCLFYLHLAEEAERHLYGKEQRPWLERLDRELANIRVAMRWVAESGELILAQRLAGALMGFFYFRSSLQEGRDWYEEVLALDPEPQQTQLHMKVLYGAGVMACMCNNVPLAQQRLQACAELAAKLGDRHARALALGMLASLELSQGNYEQARACVEQGIALLDRTEDKWHRAALHNVYGKIESKQSNFQQARVRFYVSLMILQEIGDLRTQADVLVNLANVMRLQGKLKTASFLYRRGLRLFQEIGDRWSQAACLNGIGDILRLQGDYAESHARFEESLALATLLGNQSERATALAGLGELALYQGDVPRATRFLKESLRLRKEIAQNVHVALLLQALGDLERFRGKLTTAIDYYEQCMALMRTMNDKQTMAGTLYGLGDIARMQQQNARACVLLKQSIQLSWDIGDRLVLVAALETFAWFCRQMHLPERAVELLGAADALREWLQIPLAPTQIVQHEEEVATLRTLVGEAVFRESWSYGHTVTLKLALSMVARIPIPTEAEEQAAKEPVPAYPAGLTAREVDVLRLVAQGLPDARIAEQLVISPRTVNTHLRSIYGKIGVSSRSAATRFAFEHKLV